VEQIRREQSICPPNAWRAGTDGERRPCPILPDRDFEVEEAAVFAVEGNSRSGFERFRSFHRSHHDASVTRHRIHRRNGEAWNRFKSYPCNHFNTLESASVSVICFKLNFSSSPRQTRGMCPVGPKRELRSACRVGICSKNPGIFGGNVLDCAEKRCPA